MTKKNTQAKDTPIAIIGMSSAFPEALSLKEYWSNILAEVDCIKEVPKSRWDIEDYYDPDKKAVDKTYCKWGGFMPDLDFNPMEFGLPPNILEVTDVAQLWALAMTKEVLKDAGYGGDLKEFDSENTGCVMGVGGGQKLLQPLMSRMQTPVWEKVLTSVGVTGKDQDKIIEKMKKAYVRWEENSFPGTLGNVIAGRVANRFDLGGTNCVVDAACASSLAGIRMAVAELESGRCDMMITGGVDTDNTIHMYMCFAKTPAFSPDERAKPFDESSAGIMIGEGIGMLLLKRLDDAERDGDNIYAVIRGSGSSSDGRFKSIYAPRSEGQVLALERAYDRAGFPADTVGLWEAHGTGTKAGDAAEVRALNLFLGKKEDGQNGIALGSVKSQVGHTKNAAGAAGMIKAALALHHKVLPAHINIDKPNPEMGLDESPFYINSETRPWIRPEGAPPRRAGVSAFGFGGTNFHFVLEEYISEKKAFRLHDGPKEVYFWDKDKASLIAKMTEAKKQMLGLDGEQLFYDLTEACKNCTIGPDQARIGFVATSLEDAVNLIQTALDSLNKDTDEASWSLPQGIHYSTKAVGGKKVALFSGQGSPYLNMGKDLCWNYPPVADAFGKLDGLCIADKATPLSQVCYPEPVFNKEDRKAQEQTLQLTENAQPLIGTFSMGLYNMATAAGFTPDMTAGHSFGELMALWAAGVITADDALKLARARGNAMKAVPGKDAGSMLAVVGDISNIEAEITDFADVKVANFNSKKQVVLAGPTDQIEKAQAHLKEKKYTAKMLAVSAAFHTPLVGHAQAPFAEAIDAASFSKPTAAVYANGTAKSHGDDPKAIKEAFKGHILESVRFTQEIEEIYNDGGRIFVEFGPQSILTKLVSNILEGKDHVAVAFNANGKKAGDIQMKNAAAQLKVAGVELNNLDPYGLDPRPAKNEKTAMSISIGGNNYVSPATTKAFDDALADGYQIEQAKTITVTQPAPQIAPQTMSQPKQTETESLGNSLARLDDSLSKFHNHQHETMRVHEQFLQNQSDYSKAVQQLASTPGSEAALNSLLQFHTHQSETLRVHENYLGQQGEFARSAFELIRGQHGLITGQPMQIAPQAAQPQIAAPAQPAPIQRMAPAPVAAPVVPTPVAAPVAPTPVAAPVAKAAPVAPPVATPVAPAGLSSTAIQDGLFAVVAEKTGYVSDMLELSMDMEADLGIDSIKRVEILYGIQEKLPDLPQINQDDLAELRTLQEIQDYLVGLGGGAAHDTSTSAAPAAAPVAAASTGLSSSAIQDGLFAVVAEKTGYVSDMLELSMDMEADLGIDSIKRVEILYGIQEKLPDLPQINQDDLAELRTLQEIQDYLVGLGGSSTSAAPAAAPVAAAASTGLSSSAIQAGLFTVVAEKTGYVSDMLELSMDMEADLGIDSIKRVEILYGIQEQLPDLPQINQDDLAELRTLQEILDYLVGLGGSSVAATPAAAAPVAAASSGLSSSAIQAGLFTVVAEKTGYVSDMLELSMDMEADLGIDSIKRVEILYGIQEQLPDLPQINQDDLAELRTLQEILDYLVNLGGGGDDTPTAAAVPVAASSATGISNDAIKAGLFAVVAEKTGYVADMLELSMDMEADLGIDSIKRVEILYGIQEQLPDLPQINQDDLAELRTLQEILDYLVGLGGSVAPTQTANAPAATGLGSNEIQAGLFAVVAEKTGYVADMLELSMDMEADLGIDSIKRVEILYGIQEQLPDLPQINQDDLAELRTLNEILDYLVNLGGGASGSAATTEVEQAPQKKKSNLAGWRKSVFLKELSAPDQLLSPQPKKQGVVITYDGTPATAELAKELKKQGWGQVSILLLPKEFVSGFKHLPGDLESIQLTDTSEKSITEALAEFRKLSPIASFIHIEPPSEVTDSLFLDKQRESLKLVFFLAKHLSADLKTASEKVRASFVVATRMDGKLGLGKDQNFGIIQGGFAGLIKSLKAEWEDIFCRMIDLDPTFKGKKAGQLIARELSDPNSGLLEVGLKENARFTILAHASDVKEDLEPAEITKEDLIMVSGGAKGVTAASVLELAKAYQPRLLLLGRSKLPKSDPDWTKGETTQEGLQKSAVAELKAQGEKPTPVKTKALMGPILAANEIRATLSALEAAGSEAHYLSLDITNKEDVIAKLTKAQEKLGKATGLIHGAGVLADKFIEKKEPADFDWVYGTKVGGLENLFAAFERDQLKTLILFSSSAGFYGNSGQSDYSLSNEILNKLAYQYSYANPEASVSSINWGPWDGGMVTESLKKHFESRGVSVIPQPVGTKIMVDECSKALKSKVQIVVGSNMVLPPKLSKNLESHIIRRHLNLEENAFFNDHALQGDAILPMVHALSWMVEGARGLYSGYHLHEVTDVSVLNGVILSKELPPGFDLFISELEKTADTVLLEAKVQSQNGDKTRFHYSVKILLGMQAPEQQVIAPNLSEGQLEKGTSFYEKRVLFHGPAFQMVTQLLNQNDQSLTLKCNTPRPESLGQFAYSLFNPFSEDVLLQAMLIQAHKLTGNASLPLKISKAKMFHPSPMGRDFYVTLEVVKSSAGLLEAKVYSHSKSGKVYASFESAQVTISEKLNAKFLS